jgi:hypothetical protein
MPLEYLRPDGDGALDGWTDQGDGTTNIFSGLDETSASETDFVQSPTIIVEAASLVVRLYEGSTEIAEWIHTDVSEAFATAEQTLTAPQLAAITDFSNLFIELDDNAGSVYRMSLGNPTAPLAAPVVVRYRYKKLVGDGYDAATVAWIDAVVTAGGTVSDEQKARVDTLILGLKADGLFTKGRLWLHANESIAAQALIDVRDLAVATLPVVPTLGTTGYTGNGSTQYINYGTPPSDYTQTDASFGAFCSNIRMTGNDHVIIGRYNGSALADMLPYYSLNGPLIRMNNFGADYMTATSDDSYGMLLGSRRGDSDAELYLNGTSIATLTTGSQDTGSGNFYGLARNDVGTPSSFSADTTAVAWIGSGLTDTEAANLTSHIAAYISALPSGA